MKSGSDNFRSSAIQDIINLLKEDKKEIVIYEPTLEATEFNGCKVINNLNSFKEKSDIIMANRMSEELKDVKQKVYTRDIFNKD